MLHEGRIACPMRNLGIRLKENLRSRIFIRSSPTEVGPTGRHRDTAFLPGPLPVDPLVRRVVELDLSLVQVAFVAPADEIDPEGLVPDDGLAAIGGRDKLVAVGEAADVDAESVGLGID